MTEVLQQSPSHFPSPSSSSTPNDSSYLHSFINSSPTIDNRIQSHLGSESEEDEEEEEEEEERKRVEREREGDQISLLTLLVAAFRKSLIGCSNTRGGKMSSMEIGWPSNVRHVAHVTFDRFNGFLGLPVEFEPEVPRRAPSASANVFGVSTESMQLSFDSRGNSVPTILLLMQRHLYAQGGLQVEGIFRITAGNSQEEYVRDQLNRGVVPEGVDVHCLAGLIKAWFRELPTGVLDPLLPEQVMQSQTEEQCAELVRLLPQTEAALLDWAINLMADVAQLENMNKMNARNIAMVFAPNMTQMADPLTALMYAVQVMNFLKNLIEKTLREREDSIVESSLFSLNPSDDDTHQRASQLFLERTKEDDPDLNEEEKLFVAEEPLQESPPKNGSQNLLTSIENIIPIRSQSLISNCPCEVVSEVNSLANGSNERCFIGQAKCCKDNSCQSSSSKLRKGARKVNEKIMVNGIEKRKKAGILGRINSRTELAEAWR